MDGGAETEREPIFGERKDVVLDTEFEVSVRCPGGISRIYLLMKR